MSVTFAIPEGVRHECSRCGDGCRTFDILLTGGEAERMQGLDWSGKREDLVGVEVTRPAPGMRLKGKRELKRRADGRCVFLDDDNLCAVHRHFGEEAKPVLCRMYPFAFYPMGRRMGVDVAYSCSTVSAWEGGDVARFEPEWIRLLAGRGESEDRARHYLEAGRQITADLVWEFEASLVALLKNRTLSFADRVLACVQYMKLATTGDPNARTASLFREAIARGIPGQMARTHFDREFHDTQRAFFFQLLYLALNPRPLDYERMGTIERGLEDQRRLAQGQRFLKGEGSPVIDNAELPVTFADVLRTGAQVFAAPEQPYLEAYFASRITGQRFLVAGDAELPLIMAVRRLMLLFPMIVWTARALATARGAAQAADQDMRRAVRLIDRTFTELRFDILPKQQAEAFSFVLLETDVIPAAIHNVMQETAP